MPRSAPGPVTGSPSSSTRPEVGESRPATMRSNVDLPQPEGPRMVTKSFSRTSKSTGSKAWVWPPRGLTKVRDTCWIDSALIEWCSTETAAGWRA